MAEFEEELKAELQAGIDDAVAQAFKFPPYEDCTCGNCGICLETIGYDPEIPCPHCPHHSEEPW